jgi:hypothetical protein
MISRWLLAIVATLTTVSFATQVVRYTFDDGQVRWWNALFDLNREQNLPSYYQGLSLFIVAAMLGVIAIHEFREGKSFRRSWAGLAGIFALLSIDETCSLHEQLSAVLERSSLHLHGFLRFAWVVPGLVFACAVGLVYLRFLWHLPRSMRIRFIVSGAIYVGGAVGMEMVGAKYADRFGDDNLMFQVFSTIEELMEMVGIAMFMIALLDHAATHIGQITVTIGESATESQPRGDRIISIDPSRPSVDRRPARAA